MLNYASSKFCQKSGCSQSGTYDPSKSKTGKQLASGVDIAYELGGGQGHWYTDDIDLGGQTVKDYQFGLLEQSTSPQAFMGLGFPEESDFGQENYPKNTMLRNLQEQGVIKSASASFRLQDGGSVVFGGLDISAYSGNLTVLPMDKTDGQYERLAVQLDSVSLSVSGDKIATTSDDYPISAMLDTGNFDIKLPPTFVLKLWEDLNVAGINISSPQGGAITLGMIKCDKNESSVSIHFKVGGFAADIPMKSLVTDLPADLLKAFGKPELPKGYCAFGVNPLYSTEHIPYILGGAFISHVYMVVDFDNHEVGLAQLAKDPGEPNIREIAAGMSLTSLAAGSSSSSSNGTVTTPKPSASGTSTGTSSTSSSSSAASLFTGGANSNTHVGMAALAVVLSGLLPLLA
jgi:hypothetical protein